MKKKNEEEKEPEISQPYLEAQQNYASVIANTPTLVPIPRTKKKYKVFWLGNGQLEKLSFLLIRKKKVDNDDKMPDEDPFSAVTDDLKLSCKAAAIYVLHGYWNLKLNYWWKWRWFYYVRQYDNIQLMPILAEGKKKVPLEQYLWTITLLTEARGTLMQMRMEEAEAELIRRGQDLAARSQTENKPNGYSNPGRTSGSGE